METSQQRKYLVRPFCAAGKLLREKCLASALTGYTLCRHIN